MPRSRPASNSLSLHKPTGQLYVTRAGKRIDLAADHELARRSTIALPLGSEPPSSKTALQDSR